MYRVARVLDVDLDAAHREPHRLEEIERDANDEVRLSALDLEEGADERFQRELVRPRCRREEQRQREEEAQRAEAPAQRAQSQRPLPFPLPRPLLHLTGTNFWMRRPLIVSPV